MTLRYEEIPRKQEVNLPLLKEISLSPENYVEELVSGLREVYQVFVKHKKEILDVDGPLSDLFKQQIRFIYRDSMSYGVVLQEAMHPKFLRDGVDRSIELDIFSKDLLKLNSKPLSWELLQAEQQALNSLDIPYFTTRPDSRYLTVSPSKVIENYFTESSKNQVISHLESLSLEDLEQQIRYIRSTLYSQKSVKSKFSCPDHTTVTNFSEIAPITQNEIVTQITSIANKIQQEAICGTDGSATWITLGIVPGTDKFQVQPMDYSLYEGSCGVALFLAALESVTGNSTFRPLALAALQPIRQNCRESAWSQAIAREMGIGGASGLGSIIYALVRISQFLGEPELIEEAKTVACLVTPELTAGDRTFDVMSGASGAILGLLALYDAYPDSDILERLLSCGHHLLSHRVTSKSGYKAWATYQKRILTGFSHGAAGIAYALLRLYAVTQEQSFREAAEEAIAYERSVFSAQASNWPDFRFSSLTGDEQPTFANSWCHGASGIGLARLGSLKILDTEEIRREIDNALQITQKMNLQGVDHLCCGHFGRIELFLMASLALPRNNLSEVAQKYASWVIQNSKNTGSFHLLYGEFNSIYLPSLFQGNSGIGYELLRLAYPTKLPSMLLWE
jgi:type 2 lantibiotic biosynthesis protein LanM